MWPKIRLIRPNSALAEDCDVFVAMIMGAVLPGFGDLAGDLFGIDLAVGRGLGKVPRPAIGKGCVSAALLLPSEALAELVRDDEDAGLGRRRGCGDDAGTAEKRREKGSHGARWDEGTSFT